MYVQNEKNAKKVSDCTQRKLCSFSDLFPTAIPQLIPAVLKSCLNTLAPHIGNFGRRGRPDHTVNWRFRELMLIRSPREEDMLLPSALAYTVCSSVHISFQIVCDGRTNRQILSNDHWTVYRA